MLRPSYSELMNLLNDSKDIDSKITSRYTIVIAVAKRARQIIDGQEPMAQTNVDKAVSVAVEEMYQGKLKILSNSTEAEVENEYKEDNDLQNLILFDSQEDEFV